MTPASRRRYERELTIECIAIGALFLLLYPLALIESAVQFVEEMWEAVA